MHSTTRGKPVWRFVNLHNNRRVSGWGVDRIRGQFGKSAMQNRTVHPAEFAGWRPSMVDASLWETILWASTDDNGQPLERNHDQTAAWREDMQRLSEQFYAWRDLADGCLLEYGLGDLSLEDLLGDRVEHCYVLARDGHGVSMTDRWLPGIERDCCETMEQLAKAQGPIGAYVGDDDRVYLSWSC